MRDLARRPPSRGPPSLISRVVPATMAHDQQNNEDAWRDQGPSLGKLSEGLQAPQGESETAGPPLAGPPRLSAGQWFAREERKAIDAYVQDRELEVVVILEGTDTSTGSTVQV